LGVEVQESIEKEERRGRRNLALSAAVLDDIEVFLLPPSNL
jgi:hypothetical protein